KRAIYNALFDYFNTPPKAALLASLLDSRFKKMRGWPEEVRQNAILLLKEEYLLLKDKEITTIKENTRDTRFTFQTGRFKSRLFGFEEVDEINNV
ncbi:5877_t:CDS:2, partial [Funneliformis geosporum]